eukprot:364788-Chlamydomonas_euryale.AAC.1
MAWRWSRPPQKPAVLTEHSAQHVGRGIEVWGCGCAWEGHGWGCGGGAWTQSSAAHPLKSRGCHEEGSGGGTTFRDFLKLPGHTLCKNLCKKYPGLKQGGRSTASITRVSAPHAATSPESPPAPHAATSPESPPAKRTTAPAAAARRAATPIATPKGPVDGRRLVPPAPPRPRCSRQCVAGGGPTRLVTCPAARLPPAVRGVWGVEGDLSGCSPAICDGVCGVWNWSCETAGRELCGSRVIVHQQD